MPLAGPDANEAQETTGGDNQMIGHGIFSWVAGDACKRAIKAVPPGDGPNIKDPSEGNLEKDRFQSPSSRQDKTFYLGDADVLSLQDGSFQAAISCHSIRTVPDSVQFLMA